MSERQDDPGPSDRDALISSTRSLFDSLLKGSNAILNCHTDLHAACEEACAAASVTQDVIRNEELIYLTKFEKIEALNAEYRNVLTAHCTKESSIIVDIDEIVDALNQAIDRHRHCCLTIIEEMNQKTSQIDTLESKLRGAMQELESSKRSVAQKVRLSI